MKPVRLPVGRRSTSRRVRCKLRFVADPLRTFEGYQPPPDPAAWQARHGVAPYRLDAVAAKYVARAAAAVFADDTSLRAAAAIEAKANLDRVLERVHADAGLDEDATVLYRAEDRSFWVYPAAAA